MVTFPEAVRLFFTRYIDFQGRSRRSEYWWVALFTFLVAFVLMLLASVLGGLDPSTGETGPLYFVFAGLLGLFYLATLIPSVALMIRRLHDVNLSGWLVLLCFVPIVNILAALGLLIVCFVPGTAGPNKYGPDPKGAATAAADVFV